jgi:hypothetical protein
MAKESPSHGRRPYPPEPQIHVHQPGTTVGQAVANAKQHVANVNRASKK